MSNFSCDFDVSDRSDLYVKTLLALYKTYLLAYLLS